MKPVNFEESNAVLGADQPEYLDLPVFRNPDDPEGKVMQVWELTYEEVELLIKTRRIYVMQMTFNQPLQPISIQTKTFLEYPEEKCQPSEHKELLIEKRDCQQCSQKGKTTQIAEDTWFCESCTLVTNDEGNAIEATGEGSLISGLRERLGTDQELIHIGFDFGFQPNPSGVISDDLVEKAKQSLSEDVLKSLSVGTYKYGTIEEAGEATKTEGDFEVNVEHIRSFDYLTEEEEEEIKEVLEFKESSVELAHRQQFIQRLYDLYIAYHTPIIKFEEIAEGGVLFKNKAGEEVIIPFDEFYKNAKLPDDFNQKFEEGVRDLSKSLNEEE